MARDNVTTATAENPHKAMSESQRKELVDLIQSGSPAGQALMEQLAEQNCTIDATGRIIHLKTTSKKGGLFSSKAREAVEEGEEAGEEVYENIKEFLSVLGEKTTVALIDLPKEKIAQRRAQFQINHARRMANHKRRKANRKAERAQERAQREAERAAEKRKEAEEAAERAAKYAADAGTANDAPPAV